jgi:hypothetical protein
MGVAYKAEDIRLQRSPAGAHEGFRKAAQAVVGVAAGGRKDLDVAIAVGIQHVAQKGVYWPKRQGPSAVGMNRAMRAGSVSGRWSSFMKSPTVTLAG